MILFQGDLHVTPYIWSGQRHVRGDAEFGFDRVIDQAIELYDSGRIKALCLLGDLFDTVNPPTGCIQHVRRGIDRLQQSGCRLLFIDGNHDKRPTPWLTAIHSHPEWVGDGQPFDFEGLTIAGLDYQEFDQVGEFVQNLGDEVDVLLLHQTIRQYMDIAGAWEVDLSDIGSNVRRVICGHVHDVWETQFGDDQWAYYTGSTHARAIDQLYPKSSLLLNRDLSVERLPLPSRQLLNLPLSVAEEIDKAYDWLDGLGDQQPLPPLIRLVFPRSLSEAMKLHLQTLTAHPSQPQTIVRHVADFLSVDLQQVEETRADQPVTDMAEQLKKLVDPDKESREFRLVLQLMKEQQPVDQVIAQNYQQLMGAQASVDEGV